MANVFLKSLKFTRALNGRLSFSSMKTYYVNGRYIIRSYKETGQRKAYATAAYKLEPNEDSYAKSTLSPVITKDVTSVNEALSRIDSVIRTMGRTQMKHVHHIYSSISSKEMTTSEHGLYLIRACKFCQDESPAKRIELVNEIWNKYQELGIQFDVRHYNALLDVHISNGLNFNPAEILASMEDANVLPNKGTFLLVMKKYCQDGNINGASEILEYMKKEGLYADEKVFNFLIEGHIKNNDFPGALEMVEVMRSSKLEPNSATYATLACGYAAIGDKNEMMSCLNECKNERSAEHYLKVIDVLATSGHHEHIDEVLSLVPSNGVYQQDFINAAVELIHKDQIDVAFKLAVAACTPSYKESVNIFIKQLIRQKRPFEEVMKYCQQIMDKDLSDSIYVVAIYAAGANGLLDLTFSIFKRMTENGIQIKASLFWPILDYIKNEKSPQDIWLVLRKMNEFGVPADYATYFEHVYPTLGVCDSKSVLRNVKESGQGMKSAADALFSYYCMLGEVNHADQLTELFPVSVSPRFEFEAFLNFSPNLDKDDYLKYLKVLRYILMDSNSGGNRVHNHEIQGKILASLIMNKTNQLESLLRRYEDLHFPHRALSECEKELTRRNSSRHYFVKKLINISLEREKIFKKEILSIEDEEKCIRHLQAQNIPCRAFLLKRLLYHIKQKNVARVSELITLFKELNLVNSPLVYANMISMYCDAGEIEKAMEAASNLANEFKDFSLDLSIGLTYVSTLLKYEKFDESFEALTHLMKEPYTYSNREAVFRNARRLNSLLAEVNDIEFIKKMQNLLFPLTEKVGSKRVFLEPLIKYHIQRNDLNSAVEEFRNVIMKHRVPAGLNSLFKKCINLDDKNSLQKVMDLAISCSGKSTVLLELIVAFIETYNTQKAMRVIENHGSEIHAKDVEDICIKLKHQNKLSDMEQLIYITKTLKNVDREELYLTAAKAYAERNDVEKAKRMFQLFRNEFPEPNPEIINEFQSLWAKHDKQAPKISKVPKEHTQAAPEITPTPLKAPSESVTAESMEATKPFIEYLEAGNAEAALNELSALKKGYIRTLPLETLADLIDLCVQKNCTLDLSLNVQAMSYIIDNVKDVLPPLLEKYSAEGDVEKLTAISSFIPDFSLMGVSFNRYFCKAFINSGRHEELLSELEQHTDKKNKMYSALAFEELLKINPQYEDRLFNLAEKYFNLNYGTPMNNLWAYYFSKENFEKADEIFKKYQVQIDRNDIPILKRIRENEDVSLALKYVDFVKNAIARQRTKEKAFGAALELLVAKGMYDEAVALVVESEELHLLLHKYYVNPLITLKDALEKENKPVPFTVPVVASS